MTEAIDEKDAERHRTHGGESEARALEKRSNGVPGVGQQVCEGHFRWGLQVARNFRRETVSKSS